MSEAIEKTNRLYPGLLERDQNLLFMLKCRQFVEMVNGSDVEVCPKRSGFVVYSPPAYSVSPRAASPVQTSVIQSTKSYSNKTKPTVDEINNQNNTAAVNGAADLPVIRTTDDSDVEMDTEDGQNGHNDSSCNGKADRNASNGYQNGNSHVNDCSIDDEDEDMGKYYL